MSMKSDLLRVKKQRERRRTRLNSETELKKTAKPDFSKDLAQSVTTNQEKADRKSKLDILRRQ
jgi:hypothetical protein